MSKAGHVLVHTIPPYDGGVPAKARLLCRHLRDSGWDVSVAWYASLGHEPHLVAPSWRAWQTPTVTALPCWDDFPGWAVGCRFPETETAYYGLSPLWRGLMNNYDRHVAVGGNVLVAHRLVCARVPHLLWCATPVEADRCDRRALLSSPRRWLDRIVVTPRLQRMESLVLRETPVLMPVSSYGRCCFADMGRRDDPIPVLPVPVNTDIFVAAGPNVAPGVIGFAGRLGDPRKNLSLLFDAMVAARRQGRRLLAKLAGETSEEVMRAAEVRGLAEDVEFVGRVADSDLPAFYSGLDVFVIPSWQEGLGIVGVEAASCGLPIVSTACGGPLDYVVDGVNGFITAFDAEDMARRILTLVDDRDLRAQFSSASRAIAVERYGLERWARDFAVAWEAVWGEPL